MVLIRASCWISGETFSPYLAEKKTDLYFARKNEPGEIGNVGRYRGQPIPYGRAVLEAPFNSQTKPGLILPEQWIVDVLSLHIDSLRSCGATSIELDLNVTWQDQCNLAFDASFLQKLAKLSIDFSISCYEGSIDEQEEG
ncbi:MAG: hypothetical protein JNL29_17145 [Nitrospira sp.]|nr:hypothetical protein [Nitrospira sp.]MBS0167422.1 hypothetical protein [Nitrospira sp.]